MFLLSPTTAFSPMGAMMLLNDRPYSHSFPPSLPCCSLPLSPLGRGCTPHIASYCGDSTREATSLRIRPSLSQSSILSFVGPTVEALPIYLRFGLYHLVFIENLLSLCVYIKVSTLWSTSLSNYIILFGDLMSFGMFINGEIIDLD